MEFLDYLEPVSEQIINDNYSDKALYHSVDFYSNQEFNNYQIAIIGVDDDRGAFKNEGSGLAPNQIRQYLFHLVKLNDKKILDLGDLKLNVYKSQVCLLK